MAMDDNGDNHWPAGRSDGGQYAPKAGRNADDDLEPDTGAAPSEAALLDAAAKLVGRRERAQRDTDATTGDDAWHTCKGRELGCEYADAIIDAAIHADDIPAGTTRTDMAFDDDALAEYLEDLDSDSSPDDIRAAATHAAEGAATPAERAERELKVMERLAVARMRGTYDDDSMHRAMGFAAAIIDARDMLKR